MPQIEEFPEVEDEAPLEPLAVTLSEPWLKGELLSEARRFVLTQRSVHTQRAYEGDLRQFISFLRGE
ncbi:MAG: hypothetical protein ACXWSR_20110, partial [Bdellovibrionota bacterium]